MRKFLFIISLVLLSFKVNSQVSLNPNSDFYSSFDKGSVTNIQFSIALGGFVNSHFSYNSNEFSFGTSTLFSGTAKFLESSEFNSDIITMYGDYIKLNSNTIFGLDIIDLSGRNIMSFNPSLLLNQWLNIQELVPGIYTIVVRHNSSQIEIIKILKQ
jgi:hypothetical protein